MAINRSSIAKELLPGLNAVFGLEYGQVNDEHKSLYEVENSDRAFEEEVLFTGFGTAPVKSEGAAVSYDDAQESYTARYTAETVALAFAITEEAMEDNLYDTFAKLRARGLARAMANTKEVKAANLFTNGFTDTIGDGVAFFASTHPTVSDGNQSNLESAGALAIGTLETAITNVQKTKDDRGILIGASATSLHIPVDLWNTELQKRQWKTTCMIRLPSYVPEVWLVQWQTPRKSKLPICLPMALLIQLVMVLRSLLLRILPFLMVLRAI